VHYVETHCIEPGSPWQHGQNESFHGVLRAGCLKRWLCAAVQEAIAIIKNWREAYNDEQPHGALAELTSKTGAAYIAAHLSKLHEDA
jgi:putative transposase